MEQPAPIPAPDARRDAEIRREMVRAMADIEKHALTANMIGWLACATAAALTSMASAFLLPLTLRAMAMAATRLTANRLRARVEAGLPFERWLFATGLCLTFAGFSWATLIWPLLGHLDAEPFGFVIIGVVTVGVCLIAGMVGPMPKILCAFVLAFLVTLSMGAARAQTGMETAIILAATSMTLGMVAYALATRRQSRSMAAALVENRHLGEELAEALAHAEFLSLRDPLTGLLNRRAFFENGCDELDLHAVEGQVLALDLDHFKRVNDRFGHGTGDRVLAATGDAMRQVMREQLPAPACAVRLGGEEFALLLPGASREAGLAAAERLRLLVSGIAGELQVPGLVTSASIGIATVRPGEPVARALNAADLALYRAKQQGRDRVQAAA